VTVLDNVEQCHWDGEVQIAVEADDNGRSSYRTLASSGALAVRATVDGAWLVGASAHPIGGDQLNIDISVGARAALSVRSASATLARASAPPRESRMEITATVAERGTLRWSPEPGVAAAGCVHRSSARISLHSTSTLCWSESIVLGRVNETFGSWSSQIRVDVDGRPLIVSDLALGPAFSSWSSTAVLDSARCACSIVVVQPGRDVPAAFTHAAGGFVVPLSGCSVQLMSWGASLSECRNILHMLSDHPLLEDWGLGEA
jgi:urease accessory protein